MQRANEPLLLIHVFQLCAPVNITNIKDFVTTKQAVDMCTCVNMGLSYWDPAVPYSWG